MKLAELIVEVIVTHEARQQVKRLVLEAQQKLVDMELPHGYEIIIERVENPKYGFSSHGQMFQAIKFLYARNGETLPSKGGNLSVFSDGAVVSAPLIAEGHNKVIRAVGWDLESVISRLQLWLVTQLNSDPQGGLP